MKTETIYKTPAGQQAVMAFYDSVLEQWPIPYQRLSIPTRHGDTFIITCGNPAGPPLLLLHGAGTNSAVWAGDVTTYGRDFHLFAVDLLGEAGKSAPNRPPWTGPAYVEWLEDVLAALEVNKATLVGISQGAWTALKFAVARPDHVERLVLICPGGIVPDKLSFLLRALPLSLLGRWGAKRLAQMIYANQPLPAGTLDATVMVMRHFKARVGVLPIFTDEELRRLTMPTLLLGGGRDALRDNHKIATRLSQLLPDLRVTIIPEGGHALLNTKGYIMNFLQQRNPEHPLPSPLTIDN
jgi:pimeloyl-ACP methyl ester carboxylesterase